jgi:hypothetical protein
VVSCMGVVWVWCGCAEGLGMVVVVVGGTLDTLQSLATQRWGLTSNLVIHVCQEGGGVSAVLG